MAHGDALFSWYLGGLVLSGPGCIPGAVSSASLTLPAGKRKVVRGTRTVLGPGGPSKSLTTSDNLTGVMASRVIS
jgi:hypothetical protein